MITLNQPRGLTAALGKATITAAGADKSYKVTTAVPIVIKGKFGTAVAATTTTAPTTDANTGSAFNGLTVNKGCVFVWAANSSGTVKVLQGPIADLDGTTSNNFKDPERPEFPYVPDTLVPWAYTVVKAKTSLTGTTWVFGANNWNVTGIGLSHQDVATLPDRPQAS